MRSSTATVAACAACLVLTAAAALVVDGGGDTVEMRTKALVLFYGRGCTVRSAFLYDGALVAVCREGHLQPFYGSMSCVEPPLACKVGIWPLCWEAGPKVGIPAGRMPGKLGSLLP